MPVEIHDTMQSHLNFGGNMKKLSCAKAVLLLSVSSVLVTPAVAQAPADATGDADTLIVTATKQNQSLRETAGSVSAVTEKDLQKLNAQSLSDYITRVPGVVFNDYQPGVSEVVMRGVASSTYHEANQSTTGYYLNQIPLGEPGFPIAIPDIDAFDVRQVEVLRGPQGTLFGSSSLGGAINYVVNEADTHRIDAGAEAIVSSTKRTSQPNYAIKGMINIPIVQDKLAVRLVALQRYDEGYLNNLGTHVNNSNDLRARGLRGSIVWTPTDTTKLSVLSMYQDYALDDQTYVLFGPPKTYDRFTNVSEYQKTKVMLHSLRLEQDFGFATLTALGSYTQKKNDLVFDNSVFSGPDPRTNTPPLDRGNGKSTSKYAEIRLASNGNQPFKWLVGANYTHSRSVLNDNIYIQGISAYIDANPAQFGNQSGSALAPDDNSQRTIGTNNVKEIAVFGEASYTLSDALTLTLGGRYFQYKSNPRLQFFPNSELIPSFDYQPGTKKSSGFVPKVSLSYKPSDRFMVYGLYSEGFRIGGINVYSAISGSTPSFDSDKTKNYEIGTRFELVPKTMFFDISAYHIDWENIQARLFVPVSFQAYTTNGGGAKIDGLEMSMDFRPSNFLQFTTGLTYTDARLSSLLPDSFAAGGGYAKETRLPGSSKWMISNTIDLHLDHLAMKPRFSISHRYISKAPVAFGAALQTGDYSIIDLNSSIEVREGIEVGLFAKNLFNKYAVLDAPFSFAGSVARPRTIGASLRFNLH